MRKPKKKTKLSAKERKEKNDKRNQKKTIVTMFGNLGFDHISGIDGKNFVFKDRKTEMDDMFVFRNLIVLVEYTITDTPGDHLLLKDHFYQRVNEDKKAFIEHLLIDEQFSTFQDYYNINLKEEYSHQELLIK